MMMNKTKLFILIIILFFIGCSSQKYREVLIKVEEKEYIDFNRYYYYFFKTVNNKDNCLSGFVNKEFCSRLSKNLSLKIEDYNEEIFKSKNLRTILFNIDYVLDFNEGNFDKSSFLKIEIDLTLIDNFESKPIFKKKYLDKTYLGDNDKEKRKNLRLLLNKLSYQIAIDLIKQPQTQQRKILY